MELEERMYFVGSIEPDTLGIHVVLSKGEGGYRLIAPFVGGEDKFYKLLESRPTKLTIRLEKLSDCRAEWDMKDPTPLENPVNVRFFDVKWDAKHSYCYESSMGMRAFFTCDFYVVEQDELQPDVLVGV